MKYLYVNSVFSRTVTNNFSYYFRYFWAFVIACLQPILLIIVTTVWTITLTKYPFFGVDINSLPPEHSNFRAIGFIILIVYFASSLISMGITMRLNEVEHCCWIRLSINTGGLFSFLFIFNFYRVIRKNHCFSSVWNYVTQKVHVNTNIGTWWRCLVLGLRKDSMFWSTTAYLIAFLITGAGILIILIFPERENSSKFGLQSFFIFNSLSYFTQMTNITCFFYVTLNLFLRNQGVFKRHTVLIAVTSYITIVSIVYWLSHSPAWVFGKLFLTFSYENRLDLISTFWFHTITPICMLCLFLINVHLIRMQPPPYIYGLRRFIVFPLFYSFYLYSLPFIIPYSIYNFFTNLNPNLISKISTYEIPGNPYVLIGFAFGFVVFFGVNYIFWRLSQKKLLTKI